MRMDDQGESRNVEDVRGSSGGFRPVHGISLGTVAVALIAGWVFHVNPLQILGLLSGGTGSSVEAPEQPGQAPPEGDTQAKFVSQILRSTEQVWTTAFQERGAAYQEPKLRLFRDSDHIVYLDLSFFDIMTQQLGAPGQFAHAYVIGHEVGHHVQNLLGIIERVDAQRARVSDAQSNALSVRLELQADCFAGVWASRSQKETGWRLENGDIETALNAASQIGDDTLQRKSRGTVVPESFTHGTSAQRVSWFKRGVEGGQIDSCDTFAAAQL
jgi:predicted metalloprotease